MYDTLITTLNGLVASSAWTSTITEPVYPWGYSGSISGTPYLLFKIVAAQSEATSYHSNKKIPGLILISIFYPSGAGQLPPAIIAAKLDTIFQDAVINETIQLGKSSLQFLGTDRDNKTLTRADYSVPFSFYGD